MVKSRGELIIDNYLSRLKIKHLYEGTIYVEGKPIRYDWYLPNYDVYIEYWGYYGKEYQERKHEKLELYEQGNLKLISVENHMLHDIYTSLTEELSIYVSLDALTQKKRFCPSCGTTLDDRFT
ncbi:MAG: hypothetical protein BAJALOKI1v1_1040003 [Promethearchaeota archaeon]|nr:MAG: hypothetical protein BAJALOKI1v1_1040003 [Candidatus Lokiarchaeota archaeon]